MATLIVCILCGKQAAVATGNKACCLGHAQQYAMMVGKHGHDTPELENAIKAYREEQRQKEAETAHADIIRRQYAAKAARGAEKEIARLRKTGELGKINIFPG